MRRRFRSDLAATDHRHTGRRCAAEGNRCAGCEIMSAELHCGAARGWSAGGRYGAQERYGCEQSINGNLVRPGRDIDLAVRYERWDEFSEVTERVARRIHVRVPQL